MKIPGVYVEIKGDMAHLNREMKQARQLVTEQARGMSNALNNSLGDQKIKASINSLVANLGSLSRTSKLTGGSFDKIGVDLGRLRSVTGTTDAQFAKLQSRLLATQAAKQQENSLRGIAKAANLTEKEVKDLGRQFGLSKKQIDSVNGSLRTSSTRMSALGTASRHLVAFFSVAALVQAGRAVVNIADQYALLESKIKLVSKDTQEFSQVYQELFRISQDTGSSFANNASNYSNLALALKDTNITSAESLRIFDLVNKSLVVAGASTEEASSFMLQFRQALGSGVLQGEEFRAMMEANSYFGGRLAKALDTDVKGLRAMSKQGKLTTDVLRSAFPAMAEQIESDFGGIQKTISRAMFELRNAFNDVVADANKATGGTASVASSVSEMAKTITANKQAISDLFSGLIQGAGFAVERISNVVRSIQGLAIVAASEDKSLWDWMVSGPEEMKAWQGEIESGVAFLKDRLKVIREEISDTQNSWGLWGDKKANLESLREQEAAILASIKKIEEAPQKTAISPAILPSAPVKTKTATTSGGAMDQLEPYAKLDGAINTYYASLDRLSQKEAEHTEQIRQSIKTTNLHIAGLNGIQNASRVAEDSWQRLITLSGEYDLQVKNVDAALVEFFEGVEEPAQTFSDDMKNAVTGWASGFSASLTDMVFDAELSFGKIAESFARMIVQMMIQKAVVEPLLNNIFSPSTASAKGNVFSGPGISAYSNQIVTQPTFFASGGNVMGEAGPEAILPLTRMPGGNLGVAAMGGAVNNITIINNTDATATKSEEENDQGGLNIEILIDAMNAKNNLRHGSASNRSIRALTGSSTQMIRR